MKLHIPLWFGHLVLVGLFLAFSFLFRGIGWNFLPFIPVLALGAWWSPRPLVEIFRLLPKSNPPLPKRIKVIRGLLFLTLSLGGWTVVAAFIGTFVQILVPLPEAFAGYLEEILMNLPLGVAVLVVGVGAPIFEESLCRGLIAGDLRNEYSSAIAVGFSALIFSFLHFNVWQGVPAFFTGLILGWVYVWGGGLLYSLWGHGVYNLFILGLSRLNFGTSTITQPTFLDLLSVVPGVLIGSGIFLFGLWGFRKAVV